MASQSPTAQDIALVLCPKFTGFGSFIGSLAILTDLLRLFRNTRRGGDGSNFSSMFLSNEQSARSENRAATTTIFTPRHRILAGLSVCDCLASFAWGLTSWPIPADAPMRVWNVGTVGTCTAQGFFVQLGGLGAIFYSLSLALHYFMVIRLGLSDEWIGKHVEPFFHLWTISVAIATAVTGLALSLYNPLAAWCWIAPLPLWCTQSYTRPSRVVPCTRGDNARLYQLWFWQYPSWFVLLVITLAMLLVAIKVYQVERSSSRLGQSDQLRRFAIQATCYVAAFYISWGFLIAVHITIISGVAPTKVPFWFAFTAAFLLPSQGIFNAGIYFLPRVRHRRRFRQQHLRRLSKQNQRHSSTSSSRQFIRDDCKENDERKRECEGQVEAKSEVDNSGHGGIEMVIPPSVDIPSVAGGEMPP